MALTAFADIDDLKARWPEFPIGQEDYAKTLLLDASNIIRDLAGNTYETPGEQLEATLKSITCNMVKRAMQTDEEIAGVSSTQTTVGPFSKTFNYSGATGDLYLTAAEKRRLKIGKQRLGSLRPKMHGPARWPNPWRRL